MSNDFEIYSAVLYCATLPLNPSGYAANAVVGVHYHLSSPEREVADRRAVENAEQARIAVVANVYVADCVAVAVQDAGEGAARTPYAPIQVNIREDMECRSFVGRARSRAGAEKVELFGRDDRILARPCLAVVKDHVAREDVGRCEHGGNSDRAGDLELERRVLPLRLRHDAKPGDEYISFIRRCRNRCRLARREPLLGDGNAAALARRRRDLVFDGPMPFKACRDAWMLQREARRVPLRVHRAVRGDGVAGAGRARFADHDGGRDGAGYRIAGAVPQ